MDTLTKHKSPDIMVIDSLKETSGRSDITLERYHFLYQNIPSWVANVGWALKLFWKDAILDKIPQCIGDKTTIFEIGEVKKLIELEWLAFVVVVSCKETTSNQDFQDRLYCFEYTRGIFLENLIHEGKAWSISSFTYDKNGIFTLNLSDLCTGSISTVRDWDIYDIYSSSTSHKIYKTFVIDENMKFLSNMKAGEKIMFSQEMISKDDSESMRLELQEFVEKEITFNSKDDDGYFVFDEVFSRYRITLNPENVAKSYPLLSRKRFT